MKYNGQKGSRVRISVSHQSKSNAVACQKNMQTKQRDGKRELTLEKEIANGLNSKGETTARLDSVTDLVLGQTGTFLC